MNNRQYCPECGQVCPMENYYCEYCGAQLLLSVNDQSNNKEISSEQKIGDTKFPAKPGKSHWPMLIGSSVAIAVIVLVGSWHYFNSASKTSPSTTPQPSNQQPPASTVAEAQQRTNSDTSRYQEVSNDKGTKFTDPKPAGDSQGKWMRSINSKQGSFLIWNYAPQEGESVEWMGKVISHKDLTGQDVVELGIYHAPIYYAHEYGKATWYDSMGKVTQTDEGYHHGGKRHGKIVQRFADGRLITSEWEYGIKIK